MSKKNIKIIEIPIKDDLAEKILLEKELVMEAMGISEEFLECCDVKGGRCPDYKYQYYNQRKYFYTRRFLSNFDKEIKSCVTCKYMPEKTCIFHQNGKNGDG